jgi:hypothetical protein
MATRLRKSVQCGYDEPYSRKSVYAREATSGAGRDPWACKRARKLCDIAGCIRLVCVYTCFWLELDTIASGRRETPRHSCLRRA